MKLKDGRFIYTTYPAYKYLEQFEYDRNFEDIHKIRESQFEIYPENEDRVKTVYQIDEKLRIEELQYKSYKLIYFVDEMNIFLVNVFRKEKSYPKSLEVVFYGLEDYKRFIKKIRFADREFNCLNVGKAFIEFSKANYEVESLKADKNFEFWLRFKKYLEGDNKEDDFRYSKFNNIIIVYKYNKIQSIE